VSVGNIGTSNPGGSALSSLGAQRTAASLEGQIRAAREQLNDWVTCVSATTPKGQAEIRSLSAQISAAQEHINRLQPTRSDPGTAVSDSAASAGAHLDVWA
jgi:hypothetical protein